MSTSQNCSQQQEQQQQQQSGDLSEEVIKNLISESSSQSYDPASLVASYPIDPKLLEHENPNNCRDLAPALPLDKYRLNVDACPKIVRRKPNEKISYKQKVVVRYLKPPPPPKAGDIVIQELPHKQVAPAPALVVRQAPPKPCTPPPVVIRECPPQPPCPLPGRTVCVPGKVVPPPARKVVVERLPAIPSKPQQVYIERWLPYGQQTQRIVYKPAQPPCTVPDPKNVVIQWESPEVDVQREFKNLGCANVDPQQYIQKYGQSLLRSDQLPEIAVKYGNQAGVQLAATHRAPDHPLLEGDVQALEFIDLDQVGLGFYKDKLGFRSRNKEQSASASASAVNYANVSTSAFDNVATANAAVSSSTGEVFCPEAAAAAANAVAAAVAASLLQSDSPEASTQETYDCSDQQQQINTTDYLNLSSDQQNC